MKNKTKIILALIVILCLVGGVIFGYIKYKDNKEQEEAFKTRQRAMGYIASVMGEDSFSNDLYAGRDPERVEKIYKEFAKSGYIPETLEYANKYMKEKYPNIEYNKFKMEKLKNNPEGFKKDLYRVNVALTKNNRWFTVQDIFLDIKYGRNVVRIMEAMGYPELANQYQESWYENEEPWNAFTTESNVPIILDRLSKYMDENYPNIKYKTKDSYGEALALSPEQLKSNSVAFVFSFEALEDKLRKEGVELTDIITEIRSQI